MNIPVVDKTLPKAVIPIIKKVSRVVKKPTQSVQSAAASVKQQTLSTRLLSLMQRSRIARYSTTILLVLLVSVLSIISYRALVGRNNPLPQQVSQDLRFSPLVIPTSVADYATSNYRLATSEEGTDILSYDIAVPEGILVSVSQYPQPAQFTDIPEYEDRFLGNVINKYETVQSASGVVHLGRLTTGDTQRQVGVIIDRGLLVFMNPEAELDPQQWRDLADNLELQR